MNYFSRFLFICVFVILLPAYSHAQFYQVSHLSGTLPFTGGVNVTVTHVGPGPTAYGTTTCGANNTYGITAINSGFKFSFSKPITRVRCHIYGLENYDTGRVFINGSKFNLTAANFSTPVSTVGCTTLIPTTAHAGDIVYNGTSSPSCVGILGFNGQVEIFPSTPIDSITFLHINSSVVIGCGGYGAYFYFASDTLAYVKQPFSPTVVCAGDTIKMPYYVSNNFNIGNVFTAQLSNAAGSFASPVNIGTRTDTIGDTIRCVIPKNTAGGTGYRIRIVSSSPVMTSFDNGVNIQVKPLAANRSATGNGPLCEPDTVRLFANTTTIGNTYSWTGPNSFSSTAQYPKIGNSSTANTGLYVVTMTTSQGCSSKDSTTLLVKPLPAKPVAGSNTPLCTGATLNLTATSATSGVSFGWTGPNSFTSSTQNPSRSSVTTADAGNYILTTTLNGCIAKDTETVVVYPVTPAPIASNGGPYCIGSDIQLTATNVTGATYTWSGPNGFSSTTQNPTINNVTTVNAGSYSVYATANGCQSSTNSTTVAVVSGPTVNIYPSPNDTVCGNPTGSATFTAVPNNPGAGATYQWYKNGNPISGATNITYATSTVTTGDVYSVKLTPGAGAPCTTPVNSNGIGMTVMPFITPTVTITVSPDSNVWSGLLLSFTATANNAGLNPSYQWKINGTNVVGAISNTWGAANLTDNDKISCEVTSSYICPQPQKVTSNTIKLKIRTGINNTTKQVVSIYPNPTTNTLTIDGTTIGTRIQLFDVTGRELISTTATQTKTILNLQKLPAGNYLIQLTDADGNRMQEKVVKE